MELSATSMQLIPVSHRFPVSCSHEEDGEWSCYYRLSSFPGRMSWHLTLVWPYGNVLTNHNPEHNHLQHINCIEIKGVLGSLRYPINFVIRGVLKTIIIDINCDKDPLKRVPFRTVLCAVSSEFADQWESARAYVAGIHVYTRFHMTKESCVHDFGRMDANVCYFPVIQLTNERQQECKWPAYMFRSLLQISHDVRIPGKWSGFQPE